MPKETYTYTLPAFWASALINGDESGLNDEDKKALNAWRESAGNPNIVSCSESEYFCKQHSASAYVSACSCLDFVEIR